MSYSAPPEKTSLRVDGTKLAAARIAAGFRSREAFCAALSMSYSSIAGYEQDKRQPPTHTLLHIAEVLGVKVDDLLTDDPPPPPGARRRGRPPGDHTRGP